MIRVALKGLLLRKFRASMSALAIVLGVAMISGTFVLTDTISKAFDQIFAESTKGTSVVISGREIVSRSSTGSATLPATLLTKVMALPGVLVAAGAVEDTAKVVGKDGNVVSTMGPTFGYGIDFSQPRFNSLELVRGSWPAGRAEVAIDKATADDGHFRLGDRVGIAADGPVQKLRLAAIVRYGSLDSLGGATIAAFDLPTAQTLFDKEGQFDSISVAAKAGVAPAQLVRRIAAILPASAQVKTADDQAASDASDVSSGLSFLQYFLLAFAGISLFVGAFVIFNTLSITVAQRLREFATLRTLGGSRRQVLASVVTETLVIGIVASLLGLFLGLGLAAGLKALLKATGIDLPATGTVLAARTILVSLVVGTVIAVLAGLIPALRATRVPPIAAVREGATLPRSRFAPFTPYVALAAIALAIGMLAYGMFAGGAGIVQRLILLAAGCLVLFMGVALLSARLVRPIASVLGRPAERIAGVSGRLARENLVRNPGRTAATAAALMIGLALVTFVAVLGKGLRSSVADSINKQVRADFIVSSGGREPLPIAAGAAVARAPGVELASSVRGDSAKLLGSEHTVTGIDPATIAKAYRFEWEEGSNAVLAGLGPRGAIVTKSLATGEHLRVGTRFGIVTANNKKLELQVKGIFKPPSLGSLLGSVAVSQATFDSTFPKPQDQNVYVNVRGEPTDAAKRALERKLNAFPEAKLQTRKQFIDAQQMSINLLLDLLYVLLALSVTVSLFGMVNTLALSIVERTRELGMLRAVGMTRRQVRRMVRYESVLTALIGAALGLPLGIFLAALVTRALSSEGIVFALPGVSLIVFALVSVLAGILAAIVPARRASRMSVLEALRYE